MTVWKAAVVFATCLTCYILSLKSSLGHIMPHRHIVSRMLRMSHLQIPMKLRRLFVSRNSERHE